MGKFSILFESQVAESGSIPQKQTYQVHVTRKGSDKPESYEADSYSPARYIRSHEGEGDTVHKIIHKASGKDVTHTARKVAADQNHSYNHYISNEAAEQVTEALRKVGQYEAGNRKATVHRDNEWEEYRVKHHVDGKHQGEESDYHTDDKEEALSHAKQWTNKEGVHESTELTEGLRKVGNYEKGNLKATVHKDSEWGEFRVKFHKDGKHLGDEADYHTTDKDDAHDTAKAHVDGKLKVNEAAKQVEEKEGRSEHDANLQLAATQGNHHVYVMSRGKKKAIAGPFASKEDAEKHPSRKFGDGVASADEIQR